MIKIFLKKNDFFTLNQYLLKINSQQLPSFNRNLLNSLIFHGNNLITNGIGLLNKIGMLITTLYLIYKLNITILLPWFIGFFMIKIIGQWILSNKNPYFQQLHNSDIQTNKYYDNIIDNFSMINLFNCKHIIMERFSQKQNITLLTTKKNVIFIEVLSNIFRIIDHCQWVLNNILIVLYSDPSKL